MGCFNHITSWWTSKKRRRKENKEKNVKKEKKKEKDKRKKKEKKEMRTEETVEPTYMFTSGGAALHFDFAPPRTPHPPRRLTPLPSHEELMRKQKLMDQRNNWRFDYIDENLKALEAKYRKNRRMKRIKKFLTPRTSLIPSPPATPADAAGPTASDTAQDGGDTGVGAHLGGSPAL